MVDKDKRYIFYNPSWFTKISVDSKTNWPIVLVLAHEIAHHLLGQALNVDRSDADRVADELPADEYSGFILEKLGASLKESLALFTSKDRPSEFGSKFYPPSAPESKP